MTSWTDLGKSLPWLAGDRVHVVASGREAELLRALVSFRVFTLEGQAISDRSTFFAEAEKAFALPRHFGRNWDALNDAIGEGVSEWGPRIAVLWRDSDQLFGASAQTFVDAVLALGRWSEEGEGAQIEVFLLGGLPAFERVSP